MHTCMYVTGNHLYYNAVNAEETVFCTISATSINANATRLARYIAVCLSHSLSLSAVVWHQPVRRGRER